MKKTGPKLEKMMHRCVTAVALGLTILCVMSTGVNADEADAKRILKAMSDYMATQPYLSFAFDAILEVVTHDEQKLELASSGVVTLDRPDKIHVTRTGGFTDIEMRFDGKMLTLLGKHVNRYTQLDVPGTVDHLIDELKDNYHQPLPAADLLVSNAYDELMRDVVDVKDLGSGVIGGIECDHLACRTNEVDCPGQASLSVSIGHFHEAPQGWATIHHSDPKLEDGGRDCGDRFSLREGS